MSTSWRFCSRTVTLFLALNVSANVHVHAQWYVEERVPPYLSSFAWADLYRGASNSIYIVGLADTVTRRLFEDEDGFRVLFYARKDSFPLSQPIGILDTGTYHSFTFGGDYYSFNSDVAIDQDDNAYIFYSKQRVFWSDVPPPSYLRPRVRAIRKLAGGFETMFEIQGGLNPKTAAGHNNTVHFVWESVTPNRRDSNYYFYKSGIYYRYRSPSGTLSTPQFMDSGFSPRVVVDDQDTVHLFWLKADSSSSPTFSLRCTKRFGDTVYPLVTLKDTISTPTGLSWFVDNTSTRHVGWTEKRGYPQMKFFHLQYQEGSVAIDSSQSYPSWGSWARFALGLNNKIHAAWAVYENSTRWVLYYSSNERTPLFSSTRIFRSMLYANPLVLFSSSTGVAKSVLSDGAVKYLRNMQNGPDSLLSGPSPGYIPYGSTKPAIIDNQDRVWVAYTKHPPGNPYDYEIWLLRFLERPTGVNEQGETALQFSLAQNYPNPFNPSTRIQFTLPFPSTNIAKGRAREGSLVTLRVYDVLGREVATLVNEEMKPGSYAVSLDGSKLPSGVYFYRLQSGDFVQTRKALLMK